MQLFFSSGQGSLKTQKCGQCLKRYILDSGGLSTAAFLCIAKGLLQSTAASAGVYACRHCTRAGYKRGEETDPKKRVVITGMGVASVFGNDVEQFYNRHGAADPALASCGPALENTGSHLVTRLHSPAVMRMIKSRLVLAKTCSCLQRVAAKRQRVAGKDHSKLR